MDLRAIAASVPNYAGFLTADELHASTRQLAAAFPGVVRTRSIGRSRGGDSLELLTIGDGPRSALVVGTPHPNEPVGCMTIEFLTRRLCEDAALRAELGFTWHFIKTIDPDGLRLNEGWLKAPRTPLNYTRGFFRPAFAEQSEYSFPMDYKLLRWDLPTPETRAWMTVIDEVRPDLQFTLHNADFGGVWHLVSRDCPPLYPMFNEVAGWCGVALDPVGEPGDFFLHETFASAVFSRLYVRHIVDALVAKGVTEASAYWPGGFGSADYAPVRHL